MLKESFLLAYQYFRQRKKSKYWWKKFPCEYMLKSADVRLQ